jgi:hypothetical protein
MPPARGEAKVESNQGQAEHVSNRNAPLQLDTKQMRMPKRRTRELKRNNAERACEATHAQTERVKLDAHAAAERTGIEADLAVRREARDKAPQQTSTVAGKTVRLHVQL